MTKLSSILPWVVALLVSLFVHAAWLTGRKPNVAVSVAPPPSALQVSYDPVDVRALAPEEAAGNPRVAQSSALFVRPDASGFSAPVARRALRVAPDIAGVPLSMEQEAVIVGLQGPELRPDRPPMPSLAEPDRLGSPAFAPASAAKSDVLYVMMQADKGAPITVTLPVDDASPWKDSKPWNAELVVTWGGDGSVASVLLERPTTSRDRNAELIRTMRRQQAARGLPLSPTRVVVRYPGPAAAPTGDKTPP